MIVDVIDARTNQLVWRGYDTDTLNTGKPEKTLDSAVDHVVSKLAHDMKEERPVPSSGTYPPVRRDLVRIDPQLQHRRSS